LNIDLASEYLVMAATLVHIKSRMLLPNPPEEESGDGAEEDELDPRAELVRRLLEYQKYKLAAEQLGGRAILGRDVFPRGSSDQVAGGEAPLEGLASFKLLDAFQAVLERTKKTREHQIDFERFSLSDKISELSELLQRHRRLVFHEIFGERASRAELIITFLALLEMTRLRLTRLRQDGPLEPIYIELTVNDGAFADEEALSVDHVAEAEPSRLDDPVDSAQLVGAAAEDLALEERTIEDFGGIDSIAEVAATEAAATEAAEELAMEDAILDDVAEAADALPFEAAQLIDAATETLATQDLAVEYAELEDFAVVHATIEDLAFEDAAPLDTAAGLASSDSAVEEPTTEGAADELAVEDAGAIDSSAEVAATEAAATGVVAEELAIEEDLALEDAAPIDTAAGVAASESAVEEPATGDAVLEHLVADNASAADALAVDAATMPADPQAVTEPAALENAPPLDPAVANAALEDAPPEDPRADEPEPRLAADPREYE
ncbi:MAG: hypothetical protein RL685_6162, partial [Pseudomonadota bacterium]